MGFRQEYPDYQSYGNNDYFYNKIPDNFCSALEGYIVRYCKTAQQLKNVINDIASRIPMELTQNWGWNFLINDLSYYTRELCNSKFHKVMDFLADFYERFHDDIELDDFNEFLEDLKIGYRLEYDSWSGFNWKLRQNVSNRIEPIEKAAEEVKDICSQTLEHLEQAKQHLLTTENNRDRKDAVRDCMSAMESMLKKITGEKDIKSSIKRMRNDRCWGPDIIVKDGLSIWNRLHDMYPDVRHGNPQESEISDEEALYWIERISCYIRYISKKYKNLA